MNTKPVDSQHYSKDYYYNDNDGHKEFEQGLDFAMHGKFKRFFDIVNPVKGQKILDIGCGRGEIAYYSAQRGCEVYSVDYSSAAVEIAKKTLEKLSAEKKNLVKVECLDIIEAEIKEKFDIVALIDVLEHLTPRQAEKLFMNFKDLVTDKSKVFISTPNGFYEQYLYIFKHMIQYPWKPFKILWRLSWGKFKPKGFKEFFKKAFSLLPESSENIELMHVNVMTPLAIKKLLKKNGFKVKFYQGNNFIDKEIVVVGKRI
ncbi:MAG: class I SAM-dependent methyltransferase [Candidatus Omnitrophota bacterium]